MGLGLLWLLSLLRVCLTAQLPDILFTVKEVDIERQCLQQSLLTVNGEFPGPTITVKKGDQVRVIVQNDGTYPITLHWHGLKQHRNPWSDGPEYITQNPIPSGGSFTYTLVFSDEEGTIWWHAHSDWSRASVHGAIVVLPPLDRLAPIYPFTPQPDFMQTIILGSWFKGSNVMDLYKASITTGGTPADVTSYTINGYPGRIDQPCDDGSADIYTMNVEKDKHYHLRIVNAVMNEGMFFAISGHSFTVVGLDGSYLTPFPSDYIKIVPGQTMDIILTTNQDSDKAYYMAAKHFADYSKGMLSRAILRYPDYVDGAGAPVDLGFLVPGNETYAKAFTDKLQISGLVDNDVPADSEITKKFMITLSLNALPCPRVENDCAGPTYNNTWSGVHTGSLNNQRFVPNKEVTILQAYRCNIEGVYTEDFPEKPVEFDYTGDVEDNEWHPNTGTKVMAVNYGDAVEIVFQGTNINSWYSQKHPMHIHGYNFYLVGSGEGNFYEETSRAAFNLTAPAQANTFVVSNNGWLAIRFWARNPGVWFLHCHVESHATWGMAGVLIVKGSEDDPDQTLVDPPGDYPPCPTPTSLRVELHNRSHQHRYVYN